MIEILVWAHLHKATGKPSISAKRRNISNIEPNESRKFANHKENLPGLHEENAWIAIPVGHHFAVMRVKWCASTF